jgi:hypothetical protein
MELTMGFHAFGDFRMTRAEFYNLQDHARMEFALLVREHKAQTGDEREIAPEIARWLDQRHAYQMPSCGHDFFGDDIVEAVAS